MSTLADLLEYRLEAPFDNHLVEALVSSSIKDLVHKYVQDLSCDAAGLDDLVSPLVKCGQSITLPTQPGSSMAPPSAGACAAVRMDAAITEELAPRL
jgi:hypothetical protein